MAETVREYLLKEIGQKEVLTDKEERQIKRLMPVPNDFEIIFADVHSLGGYPAGLILTDKGLYIKHQKSR